MLNSMLNSMLTERLLRSIKFHLNAIKRNKMTRHFRAFPQQTVAALDLTKRQLTLNGTETKPLAKTRIRSDATKSNAYWARVPLGKCLRLVTHNSIELWRSKLRRQFQDAHKSNGSFARPGRQLNYVTPTSSLSMSTARSTAKT